MERGLPVQNGHSCYPPISKARDTTPMFASHSLRLYVPITVTPTAPHNLSFTCPFAQSLTVGGGDVGGCIWGWKGR